MTKSIKVLFVIIVILTASATPSMSEIGRNAVPKYRYAYGAKGFVGALAENIYLTTEYNDWKEHYITKAYYGSEPGLRVKRDRATDFDTVSEGMAYGMLLAVYFDDEPTFKLLFNYVRRHLNDHGLMHWRVDQYGRNVDEVGTVICRQSNGREYAQRTEISAWPDFEITKPLTRTRTSALDADLDMAAALIFAWRRWGNASDLSYSSWAKRFLRAIKNYGIDFTDDGRYVIKAGTFNTSPWSWGGIRAWNPSYATTAWFPIFHLFCTDYDSSNFPEGYWLDVYSSVTAQLRRLNDEFGNKGLYPDWVNTDDESHPTQTIGVSDRGKQSFNCYYDAVRVPWRVALEHSWWYHSSSTKSSMMWDLRNFIKRKGGLKRVVDGYLPDGSAWSNEYADWNNVYYEPYNPHPGSGYPSYENARGEEIVQGGLWHSVTFISMFGDIYLHTDNNTTIKDAYELVKTHKETYNDYFNYYGNSLRLFSLLYLSGNMANLYGCPFLPFLKGTVDGTPGGYYYIENRKYGTYLARSSSGTAIVLSRDRLADLGDHAKWYIKDSNADTWCGIQNKAQADGGYDSWLKHSGSGARPYLASNTSGNYAKWKIKDGDGDSIYAIYAKTGSSHRLIATGAETLSISSTVSNASRWQLIKTTP